MVLESYNEDVSLKGSVSADKNTNQERMLDPTEILNLTQKEGDKCEKTLHDVTKMHQTIFTKLGETGEPDLQKTTS